MRWAEGNVEDGIAAATRVANGMEARSETSEIGYVTATFNTRTFTGIHGATLTVEVRWNDNGNWLHGEAQLRVALRCVDGEER